MDQVVERGLIDRIFFQIDRRTEEIDVGSEAEWPVDHYLDERRFERELEMFRRRPLPLAHASQLREPGDYVTDTVCGRPVLLVRAESGELRAFLNVCRHRGAELVGDAAGSGLDKIVCPYHAWTYRPSGELAHVPDQRRSFPALCREDRGLVELGVEERHGFAWVTLEGSPRPVDDFVGDELGSDLAAFDLGRYAFYRGDSWTVRFNWKCGVESFLENYHFAVLHRDTAGPIFVHNVGICDQLGVHFRAIAPKKTVHEMRELDPSERRLIGNATLMYVIFPSSCLFVEKDHANLIQIWPEAVDRCRIRTTHLVRRLSHRLEQYWDANIDVYLSAVREDLDVCESMQRGFASGANENVMFGRNELGCQMYRRCVEDVVAEATGAYAS